MKNVLYLALCVLVMNACRAPEVAVQKMRVELKENPIDIGVTTPRFSWQLTSGNTDVVQTAYHIQVAASAKDLKHGKNLLWDTGEVPSDISVLIPYEGPALESRKTYYWRVKVNTNHGESLWSSAGHWSMALLNESDWQATWIGIDTTVLNAYEVLHEKTRLSARYLRKEFEVDGNISRAVLYISGLGSNETYINGQRVTEDVFAPVPTFYPGTTYYNTYEVTDLLTDKTNTLGVALGNGYYFHRRDPGFRGFGVPRLLAQLEIEFKDGSKQVIVSDTTWKATSKGPILTNNEFDGETYDARQELTGWNASGYDEAEWIVPHVLDAPGGKLLAQPSHSMRITEEIKPVHKTVLPDGKLILDMGQNMVGWLHVNLEGKTGQPINLRFSELLYPDGNINIENMRSAENHDIYIPAVDGRFEWEPSFVYHGFRFVEVTGLDYEPELSAFTGKVIHDNMAVLGSFQTSNEMINQIYKNAYWGIRGNYHGIPMDCPQRDERLGWLGDRTTGAYGESFIFDNALFYNKWLQDIEDSRNERGSISVVSPRNWSVWVDDVTWPAAYFTVADMLYRHYGDKSGIQRHYPTMKQWIHMMVDTYMEDDIMPRDNFGDWCMPPEKQEQIHSQDPNRKTPGPVLGTTMFYHLLNLMDQFAVLSGNEADAPYYRELAVKMKDGYNRKFFDEKTGRYGNNTVTGNILSLMLGLVPEGQEERVFQNILEKTNGEFGGHVSVGVLGIQQLMRGLTAYGSTDLAYQLTTQDTYPSWGYMVSKGATTIWELWNGDTAEARMNSCNHVMLLGDLIIWYYENLAGIKNAPNSVAFKQLEMAPAFPDGLDWVKASYESPYGEIKSQWERQGNELDWQITIPANTSAVIRIPAAFKIDVDGTAGLTLKEQTTDYAFIEAASGSYRIRTKK